MLLSFATWAGVTTTTYANYSGSVLSKYVDFSEGGGVEYAEKFFKIILIFMNNQFLKILANNVGQL